MHTTHRTSIVAAFMAVVALSFTGFTARAEEDNNKSIEQMTPAQVNDLMKSIPLLPASKVISNGVAKQPPANGGLETVFEWKGNRYTLWVWTYVGPTGKMNLRSRIYERPIGTTKMEDLWVIGDAGIDGKVDLGNSPQKLSLPMLHTNIDHPADIVHEVWPIKGVGILSDSEKEAAIDAYQKHYDHILHEFADFYRHAMAAPKTTAAK